MKFYFKLHLTQKRNTNAFQKQVQSMLEVYFIAKFLMDSKYTWNIQIEIIFQCDKLWKSKYLQKYIWSILHIWSTDVYLKHWHSLRSNGLVVRVQFYQTKDPRFKAIRWLKKCISFHASKVNLMNIKDSRGLCG